MMPERATARSRRRTFNGHVHVRKDAETVQCTALENCTFTASFHPETTGDWLVKAVFAGNSSVYACESKTVKVAVEEPSFFDVRAFHRRRSRRWEPQFT
jgi:hypothetical protein